MSLLFIYIKDIKNLKEYIYNSKPIKENELINSFDNIYNTLKSSNPNLKKIVSENFCEIYEDLSTLNKGWIWNESLVTKNILYIISTIPSISSSYLSLNDKSVQTDIEDPTTIEKITAIEEQHDNTDNMYLNSNLNSNLNYGYCNNFLFPDLQSKLVDELKIKLKQPNFGLMPHF